MDDEEQADIENFQSLAKYMRESMTAIQKMIQDKSEKGGEKNDEK